MRKWISHNQGITVGIILAVSLLVWSFGCASKVTSPITNEQVTRAELTLEVDLQVKQIEAQLDGLQKQAALQFATLDKLDAVKHKLFEFASLTAANNAINPIGVVTLIGTLLGIGMGVDNRIKDKVIRNRPVNNKPPPKNTASK